MFSRTAGQADGAAPAAKGIGPGRSSAFATLGTFLCLGIAVFLIAATIVLALIPLYISNNSVARTSSSTSKLITLITAIQGTSTGRKRQTSDLSGGIGGEADSTTRAQANDKLKTLFRSTVVKNVNVSKISVVTSGSRSLSLPLAKRQTVSEVWLLYELVLIYADSCGSTCQTGNSANLESTLQKSATSVLNFDSVNIEKNGVRIGTFTNVKPSRLVFVSNVLPESSGQQTRTTPRILTSLTTSRVSNTTTVAGGIAFGLLTTPNIG